ncbi:glutaredoxin family protein [Acidovorax sp.]|uniref:glutaredoxin family protein n=1 Tax=Acidovorax sp. TaxID=1872122 RepID=UPI0026021775|nr:glutaredoxin family protein [Acidovorax sp.]
MPKTLSAPLLASLLMTLACASAQAQGVYRIVGPDGKVTFSDRPPADAKEPAQAARTTGTAPAAPGAALPFELRQTASRYPVTIYTGNDCAPCVSLRNVLTSRGVPFTERTVSTNEDIAALQRLGGSSSLPFGTIGGQQLVGFSDAEWTQYLNAAGYPKQSQLPSNYRPPAATPLVAVKPVEAAKPEAPKAAAPARPQPPAPINDGPTPSNPAGIRF